MLASKFAFGGPMGGCGGGLEQSTFGVVEGGVPALLPPPPPPSPRPPPLPPCPLPSPGPPPLSQIGFKLWSRSKAQPSGSGQGHTGQSLIASSPKGST